MHRQLRVWLLALSALPLAYGVGFAVYLATLPPPFTTLPAGLDGIAVFTGGSGRVDTGLALLRHGFAGPLLISGVNPQVRVAELTGPAGLSPAAAQAITLDYQSATTRENVLAMAAWVAERNLTRVGVITSNYHVLRCRLLAWLLAPQVQAVMLPVQPVTSGWPALLREYTKTLAAPLLP